MSTPTYDLLESVTLASVASSVTFSSIDQSYGDLVLVMRISGVSTDRHEIRYNNDSGANYSFVLMSGSGSAASSYADSNKTSLNYGQLNISMGANPILHIHQLFDYSATDKHKSVLDRLNEPTSGVEAYAYRYASTSAVNQIEAFPNTGNFAVGSTFNLYGVAK